MSLESPCCMEGDVDSPRHRFVRPVRRGIRPDWDRAVAAARVARLAQDYAFALTRDTPFNDDADTNDWPSGWTVRFLDEIESSEPELS